MASVGGAPHDRSTQHDLVQPVRLLERHGHSGPRSHRFGRFTAAIVMRSNPPNGTPPLSTFPQLLGDQRMLWMTVMLHIAGSLSQLRRLRVTMRRGSRAPVSADFFSRPFGRCSRAPYRGTEGSFVTSPDSAGRREALQTTSDAD